ncbi:hypothetical protein P1P68_26725 [Streptomyces scabiei]|uniref:hypothetical protein n=1 Tax=Streptomyces scabiei TaxID=1930 RepID=UPI00298FA058|nr:hypothetical protein [Streptomyces scabiei]MDW8808282.1 hypothetical protein [Streptomyces scabiei]
MPTILAAATGLPTILLTTALIVAVCFWLLVAVGLARVDSFDTDVNLRSWRMGGVPVTVAFSLLTVLAWSLSVGVAVLLAVFAPPGPAAEMLRPAASVGALFVAWAATCLIVRPLHRLFPDEPELSVQSRARTGDSAPLPHIRGRHPHGGVPRDTALPPRDRTT